MVEEKLCNNKEHNEFLPINYFGKSKRTKDGLQRVCKVCKSKYDREYYVKNKSRRDDNLNRNRLYGKRNRKFIYDYLLSHLCVDCGEKDPIVLEFDHLFGKDKSISEMVRRRYSIERIKKEISKCEVRCANCHRRKTSKTFSWTYKK